MAKKIIEYVIKPKYDGEGVAEAKADINSLRGSASEANAGSIDITGLLTSAAGVGLAMKASTVAIDQARMRCGAV